MLRWLATIKSRDTRKIGLRVQPASGLVNSVTAIPANSVPVTCLRLFSWMSQPLSTAFHLCYEGFWFQSRIAVSCQARILNGRAGTYEFALLQRVELYSTWNESLWYTSKDEGKVKYLWTWHCIHIAIKYLCTVEYFKQRLLKFNE